MSFVRLALQLSAGTREAGFATSGFQYNLPTMLQGCKHLSRTRSYVQLAHDNAGRDIRSRNNGVARKQPPLRVCSRWSMDFQMASV